MVQLSRFRNSAALHDAKCFMATREELDEFKTFLKDETIDPDYRHCLEFMFRNAEHSYKSKRDKAEYIYAEQHDEETDTEYNLSLRSLKKHEMSHALGSKIDDVPMFARYEQKGKMEEKGKCTSQRKMMNETKYTDKEFGQNPSLNNKRASVNQYLFDMETRSANKRSKSSMIYRNQGEDGNALERIHEQSNEKSDLGTKTIISERTGAILPLSKRIENAERCKNIDNAIVIQKNIVETGNESSDQASLVQYIDRDCFVRGDSEVNHDSAIKISYDEYLFQKPCLRNNLDAEIQCEPSNQDHTREKATKELEVSRGNNLISDVDDVNKDTVSKTATKGLEMRHWFKFFHQFAHGSKGKEIQYSKSLLRNIEDNVYQAQSCKNCIIKNQRRLRKFLEENNEVTVVNEAIRNKEEQTENAHLCHEPCPNRKQELETIWDSLNQARSSEMNKKKSQRILNQVIKKKNEVQVDRGLPNQSTIHAVFQRNHDIINQEKEIEDDYVSGVELIDRAEFLSKENVGPFKMSKQLYKSMREEGNIEFHGSSSAQHDFRRKVLDVIEKPYDKHEYETLQEAAKSGQYLDHYPDLASKMIKHRYKKGKRLAILRGFFFWLQNLTQEGAFKPWKDGRCLAVDPYVNQKK